VNLGETFWVATSALATVALLAVTGAYVWATFRLLAATRQQLWEASRPRLLVAVRTNQGGQFMVLHIENVGASPAFNLRLNLDRPVHQAFGDNKDLREMPLFANGLRMLPPNTPTRFGLGVAFTYLDEKADRTKHPLSFDVSATYERDGRTIRDQFPVDIFDQYSRSTVERDNLDEFGKKFPDEFRRGVRDLIAAIEARKMP